MSIVGIGIDIVAVTRVAAMARRGGEIFLQRLFVPQEREWVANTNNWWRCAQHLAAKEAMFKAMGTGLRGGMRWSDVAVRYDEGRPRVCLHGSTRILARRRGVTDMYLSLATNGDYATAVVMLFSGMPRKGI